MARSRLFEDLLCRFGNISDDKAGSSVDFDNGTPNLCKTCSKVNFNSLFGVHECSISELTWMKGHFKIDSHKPTCCEHKMEDWSQSGTDLLGKLDTRASACSFCNFLYQCQVRLNLIPSKRAPRSSYFIIKPHLSLGSFELQAPSDKSQDMPRPLRYHVVRDIAALQLFKVQKSVIGRMLESSPTPGLILRVIDSGSKTLTRNKRAGGGLLGRKLDPHRVNLNLIGEWLTLCQSAHSHCEDVDAGRIPGLLVIDCTTNHVVPFPPEQDAANQVEHYVTLSYLWGTAEATGGSDAQSINCDGVSGLALPPQIPLVIRDAMRVVKQLGYRYLWVDRYCIPQEDGAAKYIQILNMGRIYSNSILTIIAAAGKGPDYGLPGVSSRSRLAQVGVQINDDISLVLYEPPTDYITSSKWNTRGWTYQEGLLSKRRLVFTDLMVYFQCHEMHGDEVLSLPIPGSGEICDEIRPLSPKTLDIGRVFPKVADWGNPMTAWERISEYGPRELGYDSDALNAISGVMEMYALAAGDSGFKFFCGLPILPICLWEKSWSRHTSETQSRSFLTWFEDANPLEGASKAQRIDDNNLTFSLAYSLCWRHRWVNLKGVSFKSNPASFERARRKVFGSWTTTGWRTRKSEPDRITLFDSCLRASVQYSGELLLNWEDDNPRILDLSRNGKIPLSLNVTGLVMDVQMMWKKHTANPDTSGTVTEGRVLTSPFTSDRSLRGSPRWLFEEAVSGKGDGSKLIFLILGCYDALVSINQVYFVGMILRPVTRSSDGEARTFYEKLDSCSMDVSYHDWPRLASLTRKMEVRLI